MERVRSAFLYGYGKASKNIRIETSEKPLLKPGCVLIKLKYAAINPVDYKIMNGLYKMVKRVKFPISIGFDLAGEILDAGDTSFKAGQRVFGSLPYSYMGSFSEVCLAPEHCITVLPENVSMENAAASAMTGLTSIQALKALYPAQGESILIHAGSGGVGSFAIQYAKHLGLEVYTTTSSKNADWVQKLGADHVICYDKEAFQASMPEVDMVFDTLGKDNSIQSLQVVKRGGRMVSISGGIDEDAARSLGVNAFFRFLIRMASRPLRKAALKKEVSYSYVLMDPVKEDLHELAELLNKGVIKLVIQKKYPLKELAKAYEHIMTNRTKGKLVIEI